jgi:hypothetical protein
MSFVAIDVRRSAYSAESTTRSLPSPDDSPRGNDDDGAMWGHAIDDATCRDARSIWARAEQLSSSVGGVQRTGRTESD